ncbi:AraC family transcriptional regulator [Bifidobacterium sp. ESL0745]|uniref:AraC family transcriptional regulator n=1 Tax=Bifidobacterium sp. ESL0745 TaxID=2983226 RepID=UPI0023F9457E|nr:AraC family transcriptional regulator [Bifidobacterium sp. ESL0745]MDF7664716.1 AraC family transcriptional regulator [Bifidobacterium sp. ESL0745]
MDGTVASTSTTLARPQLYADGSEVVHYRYPTDFLYLDDARLSDFPKKQALCHWHVDLEFTRMLKGHMDYFIDGETVRVNEGETIFVNSKRLHYGFSADGSDSRFYCVLFNPIQVDAPDEITKRFILPILESKVMPYTVLRSETKAKDRITSLLDTLHDQSDSPTLPLTGLGIFFDIVRILYERIKTLDEKGTTSAIAENGQIGALRKMTTYIRCHYTENLTLSAIAASGSVGRSACDSIFRKFLAQSPIQYVIGVRIGEATNLLRDTELSITQIAQRVGITSPSYFAATFKELMGSTPKEFRAKGRKAM